jgi:tRNA-specific 2-thiouridylase
MRTVVAMSGGVDSTVAAALLVEAGHDVIGLSMQLYDQRAGEAVFGSCCTLDDLHDARRAAQQIGIPHYIVNFEAPFREHVIANFVSEYLAGRTPIPCTHCNSDVKFATLLDRAAGLGAERLATGHYVQVAFDEARRQYVLRRGRDQSKDQSYFLFSLSQAQLAQAAFPVGDMTKEAVREYARAHGLLVADKRDSYEICFVPNGDYAAFVEREAGGAIRPGVVRDTAGRVLATHDGVHHFTIGQRKGLRLSAAVPLYVTAIDAASATVTVGPRASIEQRACRVTGVNWISGVVPPGPVRASVQIRHRHVPAWATVTPEAGAARVVFADAQSAITPGQAAVFFDGDEVLGGGWIVSAAND